MPTRSSSMQHSMPTRTRAAFVSPRVVAPLRVVRAAAVSTRDPLTTLADVRELAGIAMDGEVSLTTRDVQATSYVSRRRMDDAAFDPDAVDEEGLPLVYNEAKIAAFWSKRPAELASRWANFAAISAPWLTKLANAVLTGRLVERQVDLARDAVDNLQRLGPTYIKLGQIMSIRPDVLPQPVLAELSKLQDRIEPFSTQEARAIVEAELKAPIDDIFSEFSDKPVAAASLAQVYRARLRSDGREVAVKVQRPAALSTISKDLYVLRRGVGLYEQLIRRFTAQTTDYQELVSVFAEGLYSEMDFQNEALNAAKMAEVLAEAEGQHRDGIIVPQPILELTTRRVLTMEWVTGVKLTSLPSDEVRQLVGVGQEAFLVQLLEVGFIHGDPHPGNLLKVTEGPHAGKLALLDFGLVAEIPREDRRSMVSAVIHLANRNWSALIDDFVALGFLPTDADRATIVPVMERVLGPYLRGGGAKAFNFQALSQDLLTTTLEIPFSVPPYASLLARSVATLEGIALTADPQYQLVAQAYPFVARKVLRDGDEDGGSAGAAALLRDLVYDESGRVRPGRVGSLLQAALGYVSQRTEGFVDFDAVPDDGADISEILRFVLSPQARELRPLLISWLAGAADLALRDRARKAAAALPGLLTPRLPLAGLLRLPSLPGLPPPPVLVPGRGLLPLQQAVDLLAPPLSDQEVIYYQSLLELAAGVLDVPPAQLESPGADTLLRLLTQPGEQARELASALSSLAQGNADEARTATDVAIAVVDEVASMLSQRAGVGIDTLFPMRQAMLTGFGRSSSSSSGSGFGGAGSVDDGVSAGGLLQSSNARSDASAVTFGSLASVTTVSGTGAAAPVPVPVAAAVGANNGGVYSSAATAAGVSSPGVVAAVNTTMQSPQATSTSNGRQLVMRQL